MSYKIEMEKLEEMSKGLDAIKIKMQGKDETILKLQKKVELLEKCADYYASPDDSYVRGATTFTRYKGDFDIHKDTGYKLRLAGKFARETKEKLKELE